ncbi:MAG TPA: heparin lyase I family protein, partial [Burkholderiales bacterium]|nr:heparin lyase I family protein [Burkholderiales bacterium]
MPRAIRLALAALVIAPGMPEGWAQTATVTARPDSSVKYACMFQGSWTECRFAEQAKARGRASLVNVAGMKGVRLHTRPGDSNVAGSGEAERNDLTLSQAATDCYEGREQWWAHSILFPDDYVDPPMSTRDRWNWGVVFDFHNSAPGGGQANFQINAMPATAIAADRPTGLVFQVAHGRQARPTLYHAPIGPVVRNTWYHFVYHLKWSSGADGYITAWVNGARKMDYKGPTLYEGQGCYLKLANYHSAFGQPSSVIHARVLRGTTADAVSLGPLQGVADRGR